MRAHPFVAAVLVAALGIPAAGAAPPYVKEPVATGSGGAVASTEFNASKAGIDALKAGGNAIDAAVAVASTLGVTEPVVAGPGGGGFLAIYLPKTPPPATTPPHVKYPP